MQERPAVSHVNTNPLRFEELATSLASLISYLRDGELGAPIDDFKQVFAKALREPASYADIMELTGQSLTVPDRRASRAAWLLMNIEDIAVYGVHLQLWHRKGSRYSVPILEQIGRILGCAPDISGQTLQALGNRFNVLSIRLSLLDIVGLKDGAIWLVQTMHAREMTDSAVKRVPSPGLFRSRVFDDRVFDGTPLATLYNAYDLITKAFPGVPIVSRVLVLHPDLPDFELYEPRISANRRERIVLSDDLIKTNSLAYEGRLRQNHDCLWTLPHRLDDPLFRGLPPCRGGRTLSILASACSRQVLIEDLLVWKEADVSNSMKEDFGYDIPRDKIRHDLLDRLVGQGFMRKWGSEYSVTVKGMARYQYCLAKYTTIGPSDSEDVLQACVDQRDKIISRYGSL